MLVRGENLAEAEVLPPSSVYSVSDLVRAPDAVTFLLSVAEDAPLGEQVLRIENAVGFAPLRLPVLPPLPRLSAGPLPLALPDDGSQRRILIRLSRPDVLDRRVTLSTSDPGIAELIDGSVVIAAGDSEAAARIRAVSGGVTTVTLESDGLVSRFYSVYVTAAYGDVNTRFSDTLGVLVGAEATPADLLYPQTSSPVGVVRGAMISAIDPSAVNVGAASVPIRIYGVGLDGVDSALAFPEPGISVLGVDPAPNGTGVDVWLNVDPDAETGYRRIVLSGSEPDYPPASPGSDVLEIAPPPPQIHAIEPVFAVRGDASSDLIIRGRFLDRVRDVRFEPPDGISVARETRADPTGSALTARISVASDAPVGERLVRVTTSGGTSGSALTAANRLLVVEGISPPISPVASALLGVRIGSPQPLDPNERTDISAGLGVVLGSVVENMSPRLGEVGTRVELTLRGISLARVDEVSLEPPDGIAPEAMLADPGGGGVRLSLRIDPEARPGWRRLRPYAAGIEIPFADDSDSLFLITPPVPRISAVVPNTLRIGAGDQSLRLLGENLSFATLVSATPPGDLTIGPPSVSEDGTSIGVTVRAAPGATPGPRVLRVAAPTGTSTATASHFNTLDLFDEARASPDPLIAPLLGLNVGETRHHRAGQTLTAPLLGLRIGPEVTARDRPLLTPSPLLGIAVGPTAYRVETQPLTRGGSHQLRVFGHDLGTVDGAALIPAFDVALGRPFPSPDGAELALTLTIPPEAVLQPRELRLVAGSGIVPFAEPSQSLLRFGSGIPLVDSIQPIVAERGDILDLVVRGHDLDAATRVSAEPSAGLALDTELWSSPDGTELRVRLHVPEDAQPGPRVIRVQTPGGMSTESASPANTLTIY
jgi:hypothetical protein